MKVDFYGKDRHVDGIAIFFNEISCYYWAWLYHNDAIIGDCTASSYQEIEKRYSHLFKKGA